jgi:alpha,alpha-trehalose-phosphate synthase [UDP-forming]/trehalose-phosphatase
MAREQLAQFGNQGRMAMPDLLEGRRLVVVSNREPYSHRHTRHGIVVKRPEGGLVAALDPVLQAVGGTWVAWGSEDADFEVVDAQDSIRVPVNAPKYTLRRVHLSKLEVERYYHGFANQSLWPLFHLAMDKARFVRRNWTAYQVVNRRFAEATLEAATGETVVWIHDYHLALCASYLRQRRPDLFLMQFWHIPWPGWDAFRICPQSADLLEGLLANDLLGFHLGRHVQNFLDCAERELGARVDRAEGIVEHAGRYTQVRAFPISIDVTAWDGLAQSRSCDRWMTRLRHRLRLDGRSVVVGVDRLDYTKGIPERLQAIDLLFQRAPELRGRLVFVQKVAPSRTRIIAYRQLQNRVEREIARINGLYGTATWQPIVYIPRPLPPAGMAALFRMADACLVTSLQDGMNLVAKEFVASQVDGRGVLLLSVLAGAAEEAPWSVAINPFEPEGVAEALAKALEMPAPERQARMAQMHARLQQHDIHRWTLEHFRVAADLLAARRPGRWALAEVGAIRDEVRSRERLAIVLDFDGTLAPFTDDPDGARLTPQVRTALERLIQLPGCSVAVISGRGLADLQQHVGLDGVLYVGNHGLEVPGAEGIPALREARKTQDLIVASTARLRDRLRNVPGALVEDKGLTASVHYRLVPRGQIEAVRQAVLETLAEVSPGRLTLNQGQMVFEIRPALDWDKGCAALWLLDQTMGADWRERTSVVYIGDDRTDEDAFVALASDGITVKVGCNSYPTAAHYFVCDIEEVAALLDSLSARIRPDPGQDLRHAPGPGEREPALLLEAWLP